MKAVIFFLGVLISASGAAAADQDAASKGVLRGRVALAGGRAARRASVRMLASADGVPRTTATDLDGRYEFTEVAAGEYRVSAGKPGYLAVEYGQQRPFEHGKLVTIRNGETLEKVDITLPASGAISGQIVDEHGDPVEGLDVRLMQVRFGANRRQLLPVAAVGRRVTNDLGRYRLFGVAPGQYIVMASVDESRAPTAAVLPTGYAPTYYPGAPHAAGARLVTVGLGQDLEDIDFAMARSATATISGTLVDAAGKPLRAGIIASTSQRSGGLSGEPLRSFSNADGTFEIRNVPPGEWVLQAVAGGSVNDGREGEFTARFVTVAGADVTDVHLQTSIGSRVAGRIVFEGGGSPDPTRVVVTTLPSDFDHAPLVGPGGRATARADGTWTLEGLNGPRRFRLLRAPEPWKLKAIRMNGADVTDEPLPFGSKDQSLADLDVVLTNRATGISGAVTDLSGQRVSDYTVIVFSTQPDRWYQGSRFMTFSRPKADGGFGVLDVPPGEYYVAAVDWMEGTEGFGEWQDPAFLTSIAPRATRLTLNEGQIASISARLIVR